MNLIQSICCFFSSRCASGAEPKKADRDSSVETPMWAPLRHHVVPQLLKPKSLQEGTAREDHGTKACVDNRCKVSKMPLTRLKNEYLEQDGVRFLMEGAEGSTVACSVSHETLRDHAERVHLSGTEAAVFEAYRELIEQVASDAYDAEGPFDDNGRVLVTSEALARVTRSA